MAAPFLRLQVLQVHPAVLCEAKQHLSYTGCIREEDKAMLADYLIQFFGPEPRRPLSVLGLLTGKKTISTLYAALQTEQLQWLALMPQLRRDDFLTSVAQMRRHGWLELVDKDVRLTAAGTRQRELVSTTHPLPRHYDFRLNPSGLSTRLFLAVQVISEATFANNTYVPVVADWSVQHWVKSWYRHHGRDHQAVVQDLITAFNFLPSDTADFLAARLVGHGYAGSVDLVADEWGWQLLDAMGSLAHVIGDHESAMTALFQLWGGPVNPLPALGQKSLELVNQGMSVAEIAQRLRRKESTVNEHIQAAAIWGMPVNLRVLLPTGMHGALVAAWDAGLRDYRDIQARVPDASFLQVRLVQVECIRKEQAHGD